MDEWRSFLVSFVAPGRIGPVQVRASVQARRPEEAMDRALARHGLSQETYDGEVIVTQHRERGRNAPAPSNVCTPCGGEGWIAAFSHLRGGECFTCDGTGRKVA